MNSLIFKERKSKPIGSSEACCSVHCQLPHLGLAEFVFLGFSGLSGLPPEIPERLISHNKPDAVPVEAIELKRRARTKPLFRLRRLLHRLDEQSQHHSALE